jgi:hypothetical protein
MLDGTHSSVEKQDPNVSENSWNRAEDFKFHNTYQGDKFYQLASKSQLARSLSIGMQVGGPADQADSRQIQFLARKQII